MSTFIGFVDDTGKFSLDFPAQFKGFVAKKFKGCEVEIEIRERRQQRSKRQNDALHAMLRPWCEEGHYIDDLKRDLLKAVFGTHERVSPLTGEVELVPNKPHTSRLTVAEFCELIEQAVIIAAGCGVILELPEEYKLRHPERYPQPKRKKAALARLFSVPADVDSPRRCILAPASSAATSRTITAVFAALPASTRADVSLGSQKPNTSSSRARHLGSRSLAGHKCITLTAIAATTPTGIS